MQYEDKYIRNYAFDPEFLLERKDSIHVHHDRRRRRRHRRHRLNLTLRRKPQQRSIEEEENNNNDDSGSTFEDSHDLSPVDKEVQGFYYVSRARGAKICACYRAVFLGVNEISRANFLGDYFKIFALFLFKKKKK